MATIQIPNLPAATALNGTELLEAVQAGSSVRVTSAQIANLVTQTVFPGGLPSFSGGSTGLLPSSSTTGPVTLSGTLGLAFGGTGNTKPFSLIGTIAVPYIGQAGTAYSYGSLAATGTHVVTNISGTLTQSPVVGTGSVVFGAANNIVLNGSTIALGGTATIGTSGLLAIGTSSITGGASGGILVDNAGTLAQTAGTIPAITATNAITASATVGAFNYGSLSFSDTNIIEALQTSVNSYAQMIIQNTNSGSAASTDFIVANNSGAAGSYYGDFGINSTGFSGSGALSQAGAVYLYSANGDLAVGTSTNNNVHFVVNNGSLDALTILSAGTITAGLPVSLIQNNSTWAGSSFAQAPLTISQTWTGTCTNPAETPVGINLNIVAGMNATGGVVGIGAAMNAVSSTQGGVTGLYGVTTVQGTTSNTGNVEYVGVRAWSYGGASDGGTSGTAKGSLLGSTNVASLTSSSATYYNNVTAGEFSVACVSGSSTWQKSAIYTMLYSNDAVQGIYSDQALGNWSQYQTTSSTGWKVLINIGNGQGGFFNPVSTTGTVMKFSPNPGGDNTTVGSVFDFSNYTTITNYLMIAPHFSISGAGNILGVGATFGPNASTGGIGNQIDMRGAASGGYPTFTASGTDGSVGLNFATKGTGAVTYYSGSNATLSIINDATPVNYISLYARSTGNYPQILAQGTDGTVGLVVKLGASSTGDFQWLNNSNSQQFGIRTTASADGYALAVPGLSGSQPVQFMPSGTGNNILLGGTSVGSGSLGTAATTGFAMIPYMAGTPTGTPVNSGLGASISVNTTSKTLNIYVPGVGLYHIALTAGAA